MGRRSKARKILVASIGVAAVMYGCKKNDGGAGGVETTGNLVAPDPMPDAAAEPEAVPEAAPPPASDAPDASGEPLQPVGNLMPPEPEQPLAPEKTPQK
jgi:hypothetical protein